MKRGEPEHTSAPNRPNRVTQRVQGGEEIRSPDSGSVEAIQRGLDEVGGKPAIGKSLLIVFLSQLALAGCRTLPPLPAANFSEPGWTVRQGQAIWRPAGASTEVAGEILAATKTDGSAFVQFSKTPFPLVVAQQTSTEWQIEFSTENKRYAGWGKPPSRLIWLWLNRMLLSEPAPKNWSWQMDHNGWRLENRATGEAVEGYFIETKSGSS